MVVRKIYESQRDLLIGQLYKRSNTSVASRAYTYDTLGRPMTRSTSKAGATVNDSFGYNSRSELNTATMNNEAYQRFLYRGYLQIACCDLTRSNHPCLWLITWDPSHPVATRPLAIQKDGTWYTYGWDLTKNICEVYGQHGYIRTNFTYAPFGQVTETGDVSQPIQWSSEYHDTELALVYYNYRHYNPIDGRWLGRDRIRRKINDSYWFAYNNSLNFYDYHGDEVFTICALCVVGLGVALGLTGCTDDEKETKLIYEEETEPIYEKEKFCQGVMFISRRKLHTGRISLSKISTKAKDFTEEFLIEQISGMYGDVIQKAVSSSLQQAVFPYVLIVCRCLTEPHQTEITLHTLANNITHMMVLPKLS